jgi:two-component system sensor histidine kinase YesM
MRSWHVDIKLSYKIMAAFVLITFIPLLTLVVYFSLRINHMILAENRNRVIQELHQIHAQIDNVFASCLDISQYLIMNRGLDTFIRTDYPEVVDVFDGFVYNLAPAIESIALNHRIVKAVVVYTDNVSISLESPHVVLVGQIGPDRELFDLVRKERVLWTGVEGNPGGFALYRSMNYFRPTNPSGVIRIDIHADVLTRLLDDTALRGLVIDGGNRIISAGHTEDYHLAVSDTELVRSVGAGENEGFHYSRIDGYNHLVAYSTLINDWKAVLLANEERLLVGTSEIIRFVIILCLGIVAILIIIARILSVRLTNRISSTIDKMRLIEQGRTDIQLEESGDEIGMLNHSVNMMIRRLDTLIQEVYVSNLKKREAQIEALQSQIDPHFLFNTLESIRMKLLLKADRETATIIQMLAKLFRTKLEFDGGLVSLRKELKLVEDYIRIQQYRFGNRFSFRNEVVDGCMDCMIPKLTIQPLVENAVVHGLEYLEQGGKIRLVASVVGNFLTLYVIDNGRGIDAKRLAELQQLLRAGTESNHHASVGIHNVHERLRLHFGPEFGLGITANELGGVTVAIQLPAGGSRCTAS